MYIYASWLTEFLLDKIRTHFHTKSVSFICSLPSFLHVFTPLSSSGSCQAYPASPTSECLAGFHVSRTAPSAGKLAPPTLESPRLLRQGASWVSSRPPPPTPVRCYLSPSQHKGRALPKLSHIPVIFETSKGRMKRDLKVKHLKTVACPRGCATPKSPGEGEHSGSVGIVLLSSGFQVF